MRRFLSLLLALSLLSASPALAGGFDCNFPPFGESLSALNKNGDFIKYSEKNGVSYYNYTNKCVLPIHDKVAPAIVFAFVEDRLYSKIVFYNLPPSQEDASFINFMMAECGNLLAGEIHPVSDEGGEWESYEALMKGREIIIKFKLNRTTRQMKSSWYYLPLKDELQKDVD